MRLQDADAVTLVCSRMKCCVSVLLLFCLAEAHREAQDEPAAALLQDPDPLWAELKELRDMVVEQRVQLRSLEEDSKDLKDEVLRLGATDVEQRVQLSLMEARVSASEAESKDLKDELLRLGATVIQLREKLSHTEARYV